MITLLVILINKNLEIKIFYSLLVLSCFWKKVFLFWKNSCSHSQIISSFCLKFSTVSKTIYSVRLSRFRHSSPFLASAYIFWCIFIGYGSRRAKTYKYASKYIRWIYFWVSETPFYFGLVDLHIKLHFQLNLEYFDAYL